MSTHHTDSPSTASADDRTSPPDDARSPTSSTDDRATSTPTDSRSPPATTDRRSTTPTYPDATPVGPHLVIDRTEWIPGANPEPHLARDGQASYRESYYRCVKCGEERQARRHFPDDCDGDPDPEPSARSDS